MGIFNIFRLKKATARGDVVKKVEKMKIKRDVKGLINALDSNNTMILETAVMALGEIGDTIAIDPLIAIIKKGSYSKLEECVINALVKLGQPAIDRLILALNDDDQKILCNIIKALGLIGDNRAVDSLIAALNDKEKSIRGSAANALGKIGDKRGINSLVVALGDRASYVRSSAARSLREMGWEPLNKTEQAIYEIARGNKYACVNIGEPAVMPLLAALKFEESSSRCDAAEELGKIGDSRAVEPLIVALNDEDTFVRRTVAEALEKIKDRGVKLPDLPTIVISEAEKNLYQNNNPEYGIELSNRLLKSPQASIKAILDRGWVKRGASEEAVNLFLVRALGRIYEKTEGETKEAALDALISIFVEPDDHTTGWSQLLENATKVLAQYKIREARPGLERRRNFVGGTNLKAIDYALKLIEN